ncbi:MAG: co-chaperone GroES [Phycisphaerales bacterium]|nr:co-chaperone GroES [Phycisphaerales bacterium]
MSFRPLHDKILVRRDTAEEKTAAGLYLPEKAKETPKTGVVEAVGTGALNHDTGELVPLTVKRGDRVLFTSYAGTEIKLEGAEFLVMSEDEILAVIA